MGLEKVVSELNQLRADGLIDSYAIGGAVASQAYILPTSTEDVDVFVVFKGPVSLAPLGPIYAYLTARGAKIGSEDLEIGGWPVQFLPTADPLHEEAVAQARTNMIGVNPARIIGLEHLAAIALQLGRPKDKLRLIEFVKVLDLTVFESLLGRFGLTEKWKQFQAQFLSEP